jgi:hypothetical protein
MENKFYTPDISEFHVNFEYEFHGMTTGGLVIMDFSNNTMEKVSEPTHKVWSQERLSLFSLDPGYRSLDDIEKLIGADQIRVKYLDADDFLSLGFFERQQYPGVYYIGDDHSFYYHVGKWVAKKQDHVIFWGNIKNKSELKKLLTQLEIL